MRIFGIACTLIFAISLTLSGAEETGKPPAIQRCELLPLPEHQVSFQIDGEEKTKWHFGAEYPRPFFYPFLGPSGTSLTRMGHPGAQNHDHHRSVWFAHHDVNGLSFWSDTAKTQIRQKHWYRYRDGDREAVMASLTGWYDEAGVEHLEQDVVAAILPLEDGEFLLEIQIAMRPGEGREMASLGKTNFGFLAVRVAKSISEYFGGGALQNSEGQTGEPAIFGQPARWVDYSGPVAVGAGASRSTTTEGITYFDHPENPRYPSRWHVRSDGWMGSSFCMDEGFTVTTEKPLVLRYLLHSHRGGYEQARAEAIASAFADRKGFEIAPSKQKHRQYEVWRKDEKPAAEK